MKFGTPLYSAKNLKVENCIQLNEEELLDFYQIAYPNSHFDPYMLRTGKYFGLKINNKIQSVAALDHYNLTNHLIELAKRNELQYAVDIYPFYGSDASAAMRADYDVPTALIGPGVHASHSLERTHTDALVNTAKLIVAYLT